MPHVSRDRYGNVQRGGYRDERHGRGGYGGGHDRGGHGGGYGRDGYGGHDRGGYGGGYGDLRDRAMPSARRLIRVLGRFALIAAIILIPVVILLVIGVVLLIMWLFGNAGPLNGALDGLGQVIQQITQVAGVFGGG